MDSGQFQGYPAAMAFGLICFVVGFISVGIIIKKGCTGQIKKEFGWLECPKLHGGNVRQTQIRAPVQQLKLAVEGETIARSVTLDVLSAPTEIELMSPVVM